MKVNLMFVPAALAISLFVAAGTITVMNRGDAPRQDPPLKVLTAKCQPHGGVVRFVQDEFEARVTCGDGTIHVIKLERKQ